MTKKVYIAFADMLRSEKPRKVERDERATWCRLAQATADIFEQDNTRFNRLCFLQACGLWEE